MDYMEYIGIKTIDKKEGYAKLELEIGPNRLNYFGYVLGGVYFTLSDSAAGIATHGYEGNFITINSSINYLTSSKKGTLTGVAKVINKTHKLVVVEVRTFVDKVLCTQSTFTMYKVN